MTAVIQLEGDRLMELVQQAVQGQDEAFVTIVAEHHGTMLRVAYGICGDTEMARDATQLAWVKAWQGLPGLRDPQRLRTWLVAVVANEARQAIRSQRRRRLREVRMDDALTDRSSDAGDPQAASPDVSDLHAALNRLDPDDRALLAMRYLAGMDAAEIATATRRSPSGVRGHLSRLSARLRKDLTDA